MNAKPDESGTRAAFMLPMWGLRLRVLCSGGLFLLALGQVPLRIADELILRLEQVAEKSLAGLCT